jgi:hypothetical protein
MKIILFKEKKVEDPYEAALKDYDVEFIPVRFIITQL